MRNRWLTILGILLLLTACAKPPREDLAAAENLVAQAYAYQAPLYAAEEYQAAVAALEDGRRLVAEHNFTAAQSALSFARLHALRACSITDTAKARETAEAEAVRQAEEAARQAEEAARQAEEEARQQAEAAARQQTEAEAHKPVEPQTFSNYRVGNGDTLASISALPGVYGDPLLWPLLYQGNRDQIKDPRQIYVGQVLKIPRGLIPSDIESARQKAREAGLFELPQNGAIPLPTN